jgi:hypothetical protein
MDTYAEQARLNFIFNSAHIAALVAAHPDIPAPDTMADHVYYWEFYGENCLNNLRHVRLAMRLSGAREWTKATPDESSYYYRNSCMYRGAKIVLQCPRESACTRVVTGTRTVTKSVPTTTYVEKEVTEDIVEWQCH